jgi:hypothetical protein
MDMNLWIMITIQLHKWFQSEILGLPVDVQSHNFTGNWLVNKGSSVPIAHNLIAQNYALVVHYLASYWNWILDIKEFNVLSVITVHF